MRKLFLSTCFSLIASVASAESFLLFNKDHWSVHYMQTEEGFRYCSASNSNTERMFAVNISETLSGIDLQYFDKENYFGPDIAYGKIGFWIDQRGAYYASASAVESSIFVEGITLNVLNDLVEGRKFYIDHDYDGQWDVWFSLDGSKAAIISLMDCAEKL